MPVITIFGLWRPNFRLQEKFRNFEFGVSKNILQGVLIEICKDLMSKSCPDIILVPRTRVFWSKFGPTKKIFFESKEFFLFRGFRLRDFFRGRLDSKDLSKSEVFFRLGSFVRTFTIFLPLVYHFWPPSFTIYAHCYFR